MRNAIGMTVTSASGSTDTIARAVLDDLRTAGFLLVPSR